MKKFFQVVMAIKEGTAMSYTASMCFYMFFLFVFKQEAASLPMLFSLLHQEAGLWMAAGGVRRPVLRGDRRLRRGVPMVPYRERPGMAQFRRDIHHHLPGVHSGDRGLLPDVREEVRPIAGTVPSKGRGEVS